MSISEQFWLDTSKIHFKYLWRSNADTKDEEIHLFNRFEIMAVSHYLNSQNSVPAVVLRLTPDVERHKRQSLVRATLGWLKTNSIVKISVF